MKRRRADVLPWITSKASRSQSGRASSRPYTISVSAVILHAFTKKPQKAPFREIAAAETRLREVLKKEER